MNCSVKNGACVSGFKIAFLTQLGNTKTVENSVSLLHYLADVCCPVYCCIVPRHPGLTYLMD
jgi:hypothetical protein